jgi:hypothetical protein
MIVTDSTARGIPGSRSKPVDPAARVQLMDPTAGEPRAGWDRQTGIKPSGLREAIPNEEA